MSGPGQGVRPAWQLLANRADITALVAERLVSLRYTDEAGLASDVLEIALADHVPDAPIRLPASGAELELSLGYAGALTRVGLFVVDELEMGGPPDVMTIRARAAPFERSRGGLSQLQTQKRRAWPKGTRLAEVVRKVAAEHGLQPVIGAGLEDIRLPHLDQLDESDINFLVRVAGRYDALVKPAGGRLVLAKRGQAKSASGQVLPAVVLAPDEVSSWRVSITRREQSGTVVAYWHATRQSRRHEVQVGEGEPVFRIKRYYPSLDMAKAAAHAEMDRRVRRQATLSLTMPGRMEVQAEGRVVLAGFREGVDGEWIVTRAEHSLDASGFSSSIEGERANG
ncbi:MAG: contractile injection system protein, VgrG/Pvc8 family [Lautropia sp.]|nr:contractile injection system protein, VgrG/Pvc8 family [Lautropia sp.]